MRLTRLSLSAVGFSLAVLMAVQAATDQPTTLPSSMPAMGGAANAWSIAGTWKAKYRNKDGLPVSEVTVLAPDGTFSSVVRDEQGNVTLNVSGRYEFGGNSIGFGVNGQFFRWELRWDGENQFVANVGGQQVVYRRDPASPREGSEKKRQSGSEAAAPRSLPDGYVVRASNGCRLIMGRVKGARSAAALMKTARTALAKSFEQGPQYLENTGISDRNDRMAQAVFSAKIGGKPVIGVATVNVADGDGRVAFSYGPADRSIGEVFAPFARTLERARAEASLHAVTLPDNSGQIQLPAGWQITFCQEGKVSVAEPSAGNKPGIGLELGYSMQVFLPETLAEVQKTSARAHTPFDASQYPVAPHSEPVAVMHTLLDNFFSSQSTKQGGPAMRWGRLLEVERMEAPQGGQLAYMRYSYDSGGQARQGFAFVGVSAPSMGRYLFAFSVATGPADRFEEDLPLIQRIWASRRVADWVYTKQIMKSIRDQQEVLDIALEIGRRQGEAIDRGARAWIEYVRDVHAVANTQTGETFHVDNLHVDEIVRALNGNDTSFPYVKVSPLNWNYPG